MICAWIVTSSAVVASSAISRRGLQGEGDGDHHPLAHAAGELVRIGAKAFFRRGNADRLQQLYRAALRGRSVELLVAAQHFGDLPANGEHGIERAHRILEDHRHARAALLAHLGFAQAKQLPAVEGQAVGGDVARRLGHEAHDRERRHTLAAAAFAHQPQDLALFEIERHAIDRAHVAAIRGEAGVEVADAQQGHVEVGRPDAAARAPGARVERIAQAVAHEVDAEHADRDDRGRRQEHPRARRPGSGGLRSCRGPSWAPAAACRSPGS